MRFPRFALALVFGAFPFVVRLAAQDYSSGISALRERVKDRPDDPTLQYYLAMYLGRAGECEASLAALKQLLASGDGFLPDLGEFGKCGVEPAMLAVRGEFEARLPRVAEAPVAFTIPDSRFIPEGIAHDPVSRDFFVGSIAQRRIVRISPAGVVTPFSRPEDGLQSILGITVDAKARTLFAVSTSAVTDAGRKSRVNAIARYDLRSGRKSGEFRVDGASQLNDLALGPDGLILATDSESGGVWMIDARKNAVMAWLPAGKLPGANGIAFTADRKFVYVAHSTGVARFAFANQAACRVVPPARETIAAIDGLYWHRGDLLGIQNGTNPGRVIRIRLEADGCTVKAVETLQSHHQKAFHEPTTGAVVGGEFFVLGTTQVGKYNVRGEFDDPATLLPPQVVRIDLGKR